MFVRVFTIATLLLMLAVTSLISPRETLAWEKDSHYYLKFALAVRISCFNWDEAHKIASADLATDTNDSTKAGFLSSNNKKWHAFGTNAEYTAREAVLRQRWENETDATKKLAKLGQYLHFVEDRSAHGGYPWTIGHAISTFFGRCPDSLAKNHAKSREMIHTTLEALHAACGTLGRTCDEVNDIEDEQAFKDMVSDVIANSDPKWWWTGKEEIIAANKERIETYLDDYLDGLGGDRKGGPDPAEIPDPLVVKYDDDGEPTKVGDEEFASVDPRTYLSELVFTSLDATPVSEQLWDLDIQIDNAGTLASLEGQLKVWSLDPTSEEIVDQKSTTVASIDAGANVTIPFSSLQVVQDPFLVAEVWVDDGNASNNELYYPPHSGGGIAEPIVLGADSAAETPAPGSSRDYTAPIAAAVAAALAMTAGGWYVRRRWLR